MNRPHRTPKAERDRAPVEHQTFGSPRAQTKEDVLAHVARARAGLRHFNAGFVRMGAVI